MADEPKTPKSADIVKEEAERERRIKSLEDAVGGIKDEKIKGDILKELEGLKLKTPELPVPKPDEPIPLSESDPLARIGAWVAAAVGL